MATAPTSHLMPLFVDTNLDTHLVIAVSPQDTVADLKGTIRSEHARCFPKISEVSVEALKVKWGTSFYHLSDAMPLSFAFNGVTGNWLLHLDLAPTTSIETCQTETTRVTTEASLQPEKRVLHTNRNTSVSLASREDRNKDLVASEMPIEKGLAQKSIDNAHGRETSPYALLQKPSPEVDSSIQNVSSSQKQNMDISSHDANVPEIEISVEDATAVGSNRQDKGWQVSGRGNKERKGEDRANVGTGADVANKKEQSRKRSNSLLNDQLSDGEPEHPYVEKKKRKGKKDQSSKNHVKDQITGDNLETGFFSKEISKSEQPVEKRFQDIHETNVVIHSEVFPSKPSNADFSLQQTPINIKLKKKKKKHMSKNGEASADEQAHNSLSKTDASPGEQDAVENYGEGLVNTHVDLRKGFDATYLVEGSTEKALDGSSTQLSKTDLSSTNSKKSDSATEKLLNGTTSTFIAIQDDRNDNSGGLLLGNFKTLGNESKDADIRKTGQPNNHACADPEVLANSRHRRKKFKNEKDTSRKQDATDYSRKQADKGSTDEMSRNSHDELSNVSALIMNVSDQNNTIPKKSGVISEIGGKNSQHSRKKKRGGIEPPNTQSSTHDTVNSPTVQVWEEEQNIINSPTDQVRKEDKNKNSSILEQHPAKEFKEIPVPVPAATAGNSVLETSTFPVSPVDKKKKHGHKKSEKIEPHHEELNVRSAIHETVNSSREHVAEEFSKEKSIPEKTSVIGEAVENSTIVTSLVLSKANDKKSKRRKKSENIGLPSGQSVRPESIHSLGDNVTEQNSKESLERIQNKKADSHLGHPVEGSEGGGLFEETEVGTNPATRHLIVSLDPSDKKSKRSRKKSGKSKMPGKETSEDEAINPLVKESSKESTGQTLNGGSTSMGEIPKLVAIIRENATLKSTGELDSVVAFAADDRNLCHGEKNKAKTVLIDNPINYGLDHSSENNNKEVTRNSIKISGSESRVNSAEDGQNVDHAKPYSPNSIGLGELSDKHEPGCLSAEHASEDNAIKEKAREETGIETFQDKIHNGTAKSLEAKDDGQLAESGSGKIDFFKFFDPKENQLEPVKELSSMETGGKKQSMEKSKRKKKLNPSPQNSSLPKPSVSEEQDILKKKSQSNDSGKHILGDTGVQIAGELKSRKKHGKNAASNTHDPDLHLHDVSSTVGSPRRPKDDDGRGKKTKDCEPSAQVSLSVEENKHPSGNNLMSAGRQSLTHNEGNILMVSAGQVPKHTDFNASVSNSPCGAFVTQNNYNAVANVAAVGDTDGLVASSDSTEEGTAVLKKRYRVAVRKVPRGKVQTKLNEEKTPVTPATIFDNASGSSDDEFVISNRPTLTKAASDNSSTSHDSDVDLEETQASYKISPGAPSTSYHKGRKGANDARNVMELSSKTKRSKPLSAILKATSSYKKAKLIASQSEYGDSESQDVVPETQPELAFL